MFTPDNVTLSVIQNVEFSASLQKSNVNILILFRGWYLFKDYFGVISKPQGGEKMFSLRLFILCMLYYLKY